MRSVLEEEGRTIEDYETCKAFLESYRPSGEARLLTDAYLPGMNGASAATKTPAAKTQTSVDGLREVAGNPIAHELRKSRPESTTADRDPIRRTSTYDDADAEGGGRLGQARFRRRT